MVLDELEQECQEKINENMAYALQYMDSYDYRMNLGKLKKEVNNIILIYGLCDMVNRAMTLVKYFTPILEPNIMMCFMAASADTEK